MVLYLLQTWILVLGRAQALLDSCCVFLRTNLSKTGVEISNVTQIHSDGPHEELLLVAKFCVSLISGEKSVKETV